ncbi:fluoride efflux transporter CrcB [Rhodococcus tukisamuensis]|uniref:Fluoride-specific ion channel FluC n=1 Tax=Rhodococcus tukisamuensis TaxID=168276 RepID=A0A1G6XNR0_9NOCA|nr:fluoride efflux transporter CrcB [Rhodococcus tukisamuensis]SDD79065.1 CrcB protein [Rhodococcus tukisamuensis]
MFLLVILGGMIGAPARYLIDGAVKSRTTGPFPWGTLTVNVIGSLILGTLTGAAVAHDGEVMAILGTGLCGALTTYSTFSYETVSLLESGDRRNALANVAATLVAGLTAASVGFAAAHAMFA